MARVSSPASSSLINSHSMIMVCLLVVSCISLQGVTGRAVIAKREAPPTPCGNASDLLQNITTVGRMRIVLSDKYRPTSINETNVGDCAKLSTVANFLDRNFTAKQDPSCPFDVKCFKLTNVFPGYFQQAVLRSSACSGPRYSCQPVYTKRLFALRACLPEKYRFVFYLHKIVSSFTCQLNPREDRTPETSITI